MQDFSSIITAVKPKHRTPQYKILAALFSLNATTSPVTVRQINEVLELQFGNDVPPNLNALLRKYSAYVRVAEKGPPLKWSLTEKGLEKLRQSSGLALPTEIEDRFGIDVGIVCALEQPEFAAVMTALGGATRWREIGDARYPHVYREAEMVADSGEQLRIVGTTSTSMGLTAASIVTTQLVLQFKPRIVLMIGIAAGTRDGNKQFGDGS